jgi:hypothetical protein
VGEVTAIVGQELARDTVEEQRYYESVKVRYIKYVVFGQDVEYATWCGRKECLCQGELVVWRQRGFKSNAMYVL